MIKRCLYTCMFVLVATTCFSQSKKEQIESLNSLVDSLTNALVNSKNESARIQTSANEEQAKLNSEKEAVSASLKAEMTKSTTLEGRIGTLEGNLKKSEEALADLKLAEEKLKQNNVLTGDSLKSATAAIKALQTDAAKSKEELADANKKLTESLEKITRIEAEKTSLETKIRETSEKISLCEAEKTSLEAKNRDTGKNYLMDETAVNFHTAKGEIEKLIGSDNTDPLKVVFSYLDAKYGEFKSEGNVTPEILAEMEETGSDFGEGGTFLIDLKVSDFNATYIQIEFTSSYYQGGGAEGRFKTVWFFDKSTGIKHEWSDFLVESKIQGLLTVLNKKLRAKKAELIECGVEAEYIAEVSFGDFDLGRLSFANGQFLISFDPIGDGMSPCELDIAISFAELKPFLNPMYF
jgi:predicted  nucleic acid-binding Zn-ribbon protein